MVVTVNRNAALREAGKHHETSAMMTKRLRQIIDEMEARTREALELAGELEEFFGAASAIVDTTKEPEEPLESQSRISRFPTSQGTGGEYG